MLTGASRAAALASIASPGVAGSSALSAAPQPASSAAADRTRKGERKGLRLMALLLWMGFLLPNCFRPSDPGIRKGRAGRDRPAPPLASAGGWQVLHPNLQFLWQGPPPPADSARRAILPAMPEPGHDDATLTMQPSPSPAPLPPGR